MREELKKQLVGLLVLFILFWLLWNFLFSNARLADNLSSELDISELRFIGDLEVSNSEPLYPSEIKKGSKKNKKNEDSLQNLIIDEPLPPPLAGKVENIINPQKRPRLDKNGIPVSFVIQIGSFDNYKNADNLRTILIDDYRMKAFLKPSTPISNPPYTVYVGPVLTYEDALIIKSDILRIKKMKDVFIKRFGDH